MGNYFNELRWKIIRANNLFQFIHQVTIEIRFRKSLAQERFKSNLEFRNQIIVSSIKFWKCFTKFTIPIAFFLRVIYNPGDFANSVNATKILYITLATKQIR